MIAGVQRDRALQTLRPWPSKYGVSDARKAADGATSPLAGFMGSSKRFTLTSDSVLRLFFGGGGRADEDSASVASGADGIRFLHDRCRVPGRLSGPRRLGWASYSHGLLRRRQLLHSGRVESHLIFRARLATTRQQGIGLTGIDRCGSSGRGSRVNADAVGNHGNQ